MNTQTLSGPDRLVRLYLPAPSDRVTQSAQDIVARRSITVFSYADVPIAPAFWHSGDASNRSWLFALHSFGPLDALMATGAWGDVTALVEEWAAAYGTPEEHTLGAFPWHDHATALRLDRLSVMRLAQEGPDFPDLAARHARLLLRDDFYSKHTNHGYDQALALVLAAFAFRPFCDTSEWLEVGRARLIDEMTFAFNDEGIHVENSPSYHNGMIANLLRGRSVMDCIGEPYSFDFDGLLDKAMTFCAWVTGPDKKLVLLGDSTARGSRPPAELAHLPGYQHALYAVTGGVQGSPPESDVAVFPHAGYAVYRSSWAPWKGHLHLVMKCGFLSRYHRQDDDLTILLQAFGEHWLIDSGLYNHNPQNPVRVYMRSALAHNIPYLPGCSISRTVPPKKKASRLELIARDGCLAGFRGTTHMYQGATVQRTLLVKTPKHLQIVDTIRQGDPRHDVYIQFHVPADKTVEVTPRVARIKGRRNELVIRCAEQDVGDCQVYSGLDGPFKSALSTAVNHVAPSQVIVFGPLPANRIRFNLKFDEKSRK